MFKPTKSLLLTSLVFIAATTAQYSSADSAVEKDQKQLVEKAPIPMDEINSFVEIFTRIKQGYVTPISDKELMEHAIKGMLYGLDPHSVYISGKRFDDLDESATGKFGGIGIEVMMQDGFIKVIAPIDDTPAAEAGLLTGDLIARINGEPISGESLSEATKKLRGKPGTSVTITIYRETESEPIDITLKRAIVKVDSVKHKRLSDTIGYIKISQFQTTTAESFRKHIKDLKSNNKFAGLILDLRNNPGGLLSSAISITDSFLTEGVIVSTKGRIKEKNEVFNASTVNTLDDLPVVVLINGGSASASEIVAGALQDHKRALILGTTSFGKGSVQTVLNISDHEAIKLTTSRYYTPSGRSIQVAGIEPDVVVEQRQFKDKKNGYERIKEGDLSGHLENESDSDKAALSDETQTQLNKDYQLNEAFNLLNGLILFEQRAKQDEPEKADENKG